MADTSPRPGQRPRLYLIDGYSNIFRAFYAIRNLSNSRGEPTNAVYGFIQMLRKLLREEKPELIGVALDVGRTFRSEKYEAYKANRAPMPEDLSSQIPLVRRALEAYRIPALELAGFEADDVLGTLAGKAAREGYDVILVSADKDLMQLVTENVFLFHTGRNKLYAPADVEEDFGVPPERVADVLALMGDAVDNIPGVPGIGEKGARTLIKEYGSIESLLDRASEVSRKGYRESLIEHREQALLSKELTVIHTDCDLSFEPDALRHDPPDVAALRTLFTELDFFSLVEELGPAGGGSEEEPLVPARELTTPEELQGALAAFSGADDEVLLALLNEESPLGLVLAACEGSGEVVYADFRRPGLREAALEVLRGWLSDAERRLCGHNLKEVLRLLPEGARCCARLFDLMLVSYLLKPSIHGHTLEEMALERLGTKALSLKEVGWDRGQEPPLGDERLALFAAERAGFVRRMAGPMRRELEASPGLSGVYERMEAPLVPVLVGIEERGILLDVEFLRRMSVELGDEMAQLEEQIYREAGERFNLNSPSQLGVVLFERMGLPVLKRTQKTKSYSTGAETLEELAVRGFPIAQLLLRYRELTKLKSTYVDALPGLVAADGRLHTRIQQAVAATGRLSSINPNLQNIPIRTELGQRIRKAFVAPPGQVLLVADYSQIELRILAHIADEPELIRSFAAGEDIHRATASKVLGVSQELLTAEQRRAAKTINFGILYGMSAFGLSQALGISQKEADRFIRDYLDQYAGVRRYMEETQASAEREGKVETLYGRIRYLPDITSKNWNLRENARRMAINARIQGTAADLLKLAMIAIEKRLREERPESHLLLTVHDELVFEVPEGEAEEIGAIVKQEMEGVAELKVPLVVEVGYGPTWYDAKE